MEKLLAGSALALLSMSGAAFAQDAISACLITKTETNPFFVKMREGPQAAADAAGIELYSYAGQYDGDHEAQVQAVETCVASGVSGILLVPSDSSAMVSSVQQARDAGVLVITLDTPLNSIDAADATCRTFSKSRTASTSTGLASGSA